MGVITISRQNGSLGDEIANLVAKELGYEVMDHEKVHQLAMSCDSAYQDTCTLYEKEEGQKFWDRFFFSNPANTSLFESMTYELASKGNVVLLGRGAQLVLKDVPGVFKVRLIAPMDVRVSRVVATQGISEREAVKFINWHDKQRRNLVESVFEHDLSDVSLFDMVLNTKSYNAESAAKIILLAAKEIVDTGALDAQTLHLDQKALEKKIETHIRRELIFPYQKTFDVSMKDGGVIRLTGLVSDPQSKERAGEIAAGYPEVKKVENEMTVANLSY